MDSRPDQAGEAPLRALVFAPYGRDVELLGGAVTEAGASPMVCHDMPDLITRIGDGGADLLIVSDDGFAEGGDDRLLTALRSRTAAGDDLLPLVILTGSSDLVHPLTRLPGAVVIAKPTRRRILDSVLRGALEIRRRVLELQAQRHELETQSRDLREMTEELGSRNLSLADALKSKDRFVATMSHELRTPLNAVISYADLLDLEIDVPLSEKQHTHVNRITASAQHLVRLIAEVLDFAKMNAGQLAVEACPLDIVAQAEEAVALVTSGAHSKGLELTIESPPESLPTASGDRLRVRQVLLNLLSNAIKFTDYGQVTVRFGLMGDDAVSVIVQDTGVGVAEDDLPRLFEDFYQVDGEPTRTRGGSGLGLAISRRLVLLMGGELSAESQLGEGSTFIFTLPVAQEP